MGYDLGIALIAFSFRFQKSYGLFNHSFSVVLRLNMWLPTTFYHTYNPSPRCVSQVEPVVVLFVILPLCFLL